MTNRGLPPARSARRATAAGASDMFASARTTASCSATSDPSGSIVTSSAPASLGKTGAPGRRVHTVSHAVVAAIADDVDQQPARCVVDPVSVLHEQHRARRDDAAAAARRRPLACAPAGTRARCARPRGSRRPRRRAGSRAVEATARARRRARARTRSAPRRHRRGRRRHRRRPTCAAWTAPRDTASLASTGRTRPSAPTGGRSRRRNSCNNRLLPMPGSATTSIAYPTCSAVARRASESRCNSFSRPTNGARSISSVARSDVTSLPTDGRLDRLRFALHEERFQRLELEATLAGRRAWRGSR